jgi:hypothetical protein
MLGGTVAVYIDFSVGVGEGLVQTRISYVFM